MKKTQHAPMTIKRSHRLAAASVLAVLGLGVTSAYAWHGTTLSASVNCAATNPAKATITGSVVSGYSSDQSGWNKGWQLTVTGPQEASPTPHILRFTPVSDGTDKGEGTFTVSAGGLQDGDYKITLQNSMDAGTHLTTNPASVTSFDVICASVPDPHTQATPELGSGELLATGILPIGAVLLYRRRRARRTGQTATRPNA